MDNLDKTVEQLKILFSNQFTREEYECIEELCREEVYEGNGTISWQASMKSIHQKCRNMKLN